MKEIIFAATATGHVRSAMRGAAIGVGVMLLAACSARPQAIGQGGLEQLTAAGPSTRPGWMASYASADHAQVPLARLPDAAGKVRKVWQHLYSNGLRQTISLESRLSPSLTSAIEIEVQAADQRTLDDPLRVEKPTEASVRSQIGATFPALPMHIVTEPRGNRYGPYGLAVGKSGDGVRCIFAWQWIDRNTAVERIQIDAAVAWRIHLCDKDTTLDQLAGHVDALQIRAEGFGEAGPASAADTSRPSKAASLAIRRKSAARYSRPSKPPGGIISPAAGATAYLAPLPEAAPNAASPQAGIHAAALDPTLPPEAFRGPSSVSR
jgi:hypothetical protein